MVRYKAADGKWRRAPAARGGNGRVKPGYAVVAGKQVKVEGATYELRSYEDRQAVYTPAGSNASSADAQCRRMQRQNTVIAAAEKAGVQVIGQSDRKTLQESAAGYIEDCAMRGAKEAQQQARLVCEEFCSMARKAYLDEITRDDVLRFHAALRKRGMSDRTVANKHERLKSWFIWAKIDISFMPPTPKYEEALPTVYSKEKVHRLLDAADDYMEAVISIALKCGLRDQELMFLEWTDIDWTHSVLRVRGKAQYNFVVKDKEQRDVPVPPDLLRLLKGRRKTLGERNLILGLPNGKPNTHLLRDLKRLVYKAGLHCGLCQSCKERNECEQWELHKFRRTYITTLLRNRIDLRTVQAFAGHADLGSTMRYLTPASTSEVRDKIAAIEW